VWVTDFQNDTVSQYDPTTPRLDPASGLGLVRSFPRAGLGPSGVLVAPGAVWVALSREDSVIRIDPASGAVVAKVPTGSRPLAMVELAGSLWVRNEKSSSVTRIDETTNKVLATVPITYFQGRDGQDAMAVASGHIWTSGVVLDQIDPASGAVSRRVAHSSITLASDGEALWTTDIDGSVSRIRT
jgi:YVTN family beta-propeller protein